MNAKKTGLLLLACIGIAASASAQKFTWSNAAPSQNETDSKTEYHIDGKLYRINSRNNEELFNRDVTVSSYSLSDLNKEGTQDFSVPQPPIGKATMTHLEMYQEKATDYVIFLDDYNPKTKERELYFQRVNINTNTKTKPALITAMPTRNSTYYISQSPNKQFYAVIKQHSYDKKANEKLNVTLIDKDFKVLKEISYELPYLNKTPLDNTIFVSDQGTVFVVKSIEVPKAKPFKSVFYWDGNAATMQETSLKLDNDYQIYQYKGHFEGDDFFIHGLYTRIGAATFQVYSGNVPAAGVYAARFNGRGEKRYTQTSDTGDINSLRLKDIMADGMKTWFFADEMISNRKARPIAKDSFTLIYDYNYSNSAFVFGKIDNETGKLEWHKVVPTSEPSTANDNGAYLSFVYFLKNSQLSILYNDTQKTKIANKTANDRFIAMETFDDRGNQVSKSLLAETGLEIKLDSDQRYFLENFDLDTSVNVKVQDGKYILRGKSPANEKMGYFTF